MVTREYIDKYELINRLMRTDHSTPEKAENSFNEVIKNIPVTNLNLSKQLTAEEAFWLNHYIDVTLFEVMNKHQEFCDIDKLRCIISAFDKLKDMSENYR